ncbi:uncharacterized protein LOC143773609 [Ranitomeya variabilis]|uniref:uncharacterized protein LOC143773609 n=1 Tax=Ranitomeya variabilis TaxID=490064 RepID=UPI00405773B2
MSTDTFAYDIATSSNILSQVTSSAEFLKIPATDLRTRDYEKTKRKLVSYDLHCITLAEYHRQSKIPRGLRSHLRPTLFADNQEYCDKYQKILNKCSLDIIVLTVEYLQKEISEIRKNIQAIESQLAATLPSAEWSTLKEKTDKIITEHQKNLQDRKRQKFQRDNDDYLSNRVYRWSDSNTFTSWRRRPMQRRFDSHSSGSDSSVGSTRPPFLGKGRRGGYQHGDQSDGRGERMTTRSQTR